MSASSQNNTEMDVLLDLTEYDSPSLSPSLTAKSSFASPISAVVSTPSLPTTTQTLSGPSHNYGMYRQQTGFVPGALTDAMAVNQAHNAGYQDFGSLDYLPDIGSQDDIFSFNAPPSQGGMCPPDLDLDFDNSPSDSHDMFGTVDPSKIEHDASVPTQVAMQPSIGRLYPGAHSAMAAQAQQRQQQQQMMQQQVQRQQPAQQKSRSKSSQPTDPIVEQKITQLLNSMRAKPSTAEDRTQQTTSTLTRAKKEEEDMDEDERLLASEEGKKLSSKERRQLRNKVSARAFRSRRKEYITQLETEIAAKVNENGELKVQNRALLEENRRLSDLTRMLLSSSSFSNFLEDLSSRPPEAPTPIKQEPQSQSQMPKDVNPYGAQSSQSQQQIGMAMIPENNVDFSMLNIDNPYSYQPQVFVVETPEIPAIDTTMLSGKASNFVEPTLESDAKMDAPMIERPVMEKDRTVPGEELLVDAEFENNPEYALYHSEPAQSGEDSNVLDAETSLATDIFGGIPTHKILARYDLVDASEVEASSVVAMARIHHISDRIESLVSRLELLTMDI